MTNDHPSPSAPSWRLPALAVGAALLVAATYYPGLSGGFVYDDFPFIVDNQDLHVTTLQLSDWWRAIESFPAAHQGRWLTMLTFAANHYMSGGVDPFWLKLTNLAIHLVNGLLLFIALKTLLAIFRAANPDTDDAGRDGWIAFGVASAWLLLPINLTGVLYAAQRLESFSNTFVFLGLWLYFRSRLQLAKDTGGMAGMATALVLCTGVGLLAKESAVLLPLYAACAEFALGSAHRGYRHRRAIFSLYAGLLVLPLIFGLYWLSGWIGGGSTYERSFTTAQRLMTEARVLVDYIHWCLLPMPHSLSMYHDDIAISKGLLSPPTTLLSLVVLAALLGIAIAQRNRRPLFCLGVLWFFAGHALTATVIPLELVYEHRNYFASCGLLLSVASLLTQRPPAFVTGRAAATVALVFIAFYALSTNLRAREWSHPLRLALLEVDQHPQSPSAQYELGRTLLVAIGDNADSPMIQRARDALETCMRIPDANVLCAQGLIAMAARLHQPVDPAWWQSIVARLNMHTPTESDITALQALGKCQQEGRCPDQRDELAAALLAALAHPNPNPRLIGAYADFSMWAMNDPDLTERLYRELIERKPRLVVAHANYAIVLAAHGRLDEARSELRVLKGLNILGSIDASIANVEEAISLAQARAADGDSVLSVERDRNTHSE